MKAANDMSQADLGRATGISSGTISKWLSGDVQPDIPQLRRVAATLRIPVLTLAVAAGHFTPKEAQLKDMPALPQPVEVDPVEAEIRAGGYTAEVEEMLLKIRQDNRRQVQELIAVLEKDGTIKGAKQPSR